MSRRFRETDKYNLGPAGYAWRITDDKITYPDTTENPFDGLEGPRGCTIPEAAVKEGPKEKFRMRDDDGNIYCEGIIIGQFDGFEPLDDFGMPGLGCTEIQYLLDNGWETL